jgi:hypothetical protein
VVDIGSFGGLMHPYLPMCGYRKIIMTNVPVWVYPATTVKITLQDIPAKILTDNTFI